MPSSTSTLWQSFRAIFQKEFLHLRRDKGTFALAFGIPLFQLILFGFIDQTVHNVATVVVDQDRSTDSRELIDRLRATGTFRIKRITENPHDARNDITAGPTTTTSGRATPTPRSSCSSTAATRPCRRRRWPR
jgi:hypothetical protein